MTDERVQQPPARNRTMVVDAERQRLIRRTATVSFIGASVDSYDFFIYGTAAAIVFPKVFFPQSTPLVGLLLSFASFGVGFVARPIGGVIFGHIGDKRGRKFALVSCLLGMALCTTAMGLLPSYATIGPAAGVLLVILRLIQGIFFGGEAGGALMLLGEVAPQKRRGLYGAIAIAGAPGGIIIANGVFFIVTAMMGDDAFTSWGWRIPFLSSVVLIAISIYANSRLRESPSFLATPDNQGSKNVTEPRDTKDGSPVLKAIQGHWKEILLGAGTYAALNVSFYVIATFAVQHATGPDVGMSKHTVLGVLLIASFVMLVWSIAAGHLSDLYGRHRMLLIGAGGFAVWSFVMWPLINAGSFWMLLIAFVVGLGGFAGILSGVVGSFLMELFPTSVRFSGVSLSVQVASVLAGAFAPLIAAALYGAYASTLPVAVLVAAWCVITVISVAVLKVIRSTPYEI